MPTPKASSAATAVIALACSGAEIRIRGQLFPRRFVRMDRIMLGGRSAWERGRQSGLRLDPNSLEFPKPVEGVDHRKRSAHSDPMWLYPVSEQRSTYDRLGRPTQEAPCNTCSLLLAAIRLGRATFRPGRPEPL
jgi:hypothetical protein